MGTGEALNEYSSVGVWPAYETRQAMLREAIELMRQLWTGEEVSFEGDYYTTHKARLYTLPDEPIPLYISTLVPESAEFAGEYGDGLITTGGKEPGAYKELLKAFEKGAKKGGKDPADMPRLIELSVAYTDDIEGAVQEMKKYWAGTFIPALFNQNIYTPKMSAENGKAVEGDAVRKRGCFSADPEEHVQFAAGVHGPGVRPPVFPFGGAGPDGVHREVWEGCAAEAEGEGDGEVVKSFNHDPLTGAGGTRNTKEEKGLVDKGFNRGRGMGRRNI